MAQILHAALNHSSIDSGIPHESDSRVVGSLHEAAASSGLFAVTLQPGPHRWFFSTSGRGRRQQSGATLALTLRAAQCIKRRLYLQPKVARSPSWIRTRCIAEGRNARSLLNPPVHRPARSRLRSEEHTSEL